GVRLPHARRLPDRDRRFEARDPAGTGSLSRAVLGGLRRLRAGHSTVQVTRMFGIQDIALFVAAGLLLNATPGPDTAYIVGRSVQLGWRGGAAAALGIGAGCLVHIVAAAVGLSALLTASATAFMVVKYVGAAYLCYVGLRMLFVRRAVADIAPATDATTTRAV